MQRDLKKQCALKQHYAPKKHYAPQPKPAALGVYTTGSMPTEAEMRAALELRHTKAVQDKLSAAKVAVCGLGGLGSAVAIALARAGVGSGSGHLHLIDFDRVDLTNLNRQQYAASQLGMPKSGAMAEEIRRFSPYANLKTDFVKLTEENIPRLLAEDDFICEAFDAPEQKAMLTNCVLEAFPGKYLVGASGMAGCADSNEIRTRRITRHYYLCGDGVSEIGEGRGLMAPRVMVCAAHQANMIVRLILGGADCANVRQERRERQKE